MPTRSRPDPEGPELAILEARLGVTFKNLSLLEKALTHRSSAASRAGGPDNERLEFLGDAVLELAVSDLLFRMGRNEDEGRLTQIRSQLVCKDQLARLGLKLGLSEFLRLGRGERGGGGALKASLNANCFEAILGAVYVDQSFSVAQAVVRRLFLSPIRYRLRKTHAKDPKSLLQEISLARYNCLPRYVMVKETGADHDRRFHVKVVLKDQVEASGAGKSKKAAQQQAAAAALRKLESHSSA